MIMPVKETATFIDQDRCPVCTGPFSLIDRTRTIDPHAPDLFELRQCTRCGHWWHSPMPTQDHLIQLYNSGSASVVPENYTQQIQKSPGTALRGFGAWIYRHEKDKPGSRCLEIGVGGGHLLTQLRIKGFICHGIEPGRWAAGSGVYPDIDHLPQDGKYDIFILSDVLEHLTSPLEMLRDLGKLGHSGSRIYCSFPNKDSLPALLRKGAWSMVRPLGHLHYFSHQSVSLLFSKAAWEIAECRKTNALHNDLLSSANPFRLAVKIITIPLYWHDQFWVRAVKH